MNDRPIFITGTMRNGGSLLQNMLSVHSEVLIFAGFILFFRFYHKKYEPLNPENVERMMQHLRLRLKYRRGFDLNVERIIENVIKRDCSYTACYEEIINELSTYTNKRILGEYVTLGWRNIPDFIEMFPNAKIIHMCRDLRAIVSSFSRTTNMQENLYLNAIFNWVDSVNHIKQYKKELSSEQYLVLKFEDIHENPKATISHLCDFLEIDFEDSMVEPETWTKLFDKNFVDANISAYTFEKVYGFDIARTKKWIQSIDIQDLHLAEFIAGEKLLEMGYTLALEEFDQNILTKGLNQMTSQPILSKNYEKLKTMNEGTDQSAMDPSDPNNWDVAGQEGDLARIKFLDHSTGKRYLKELNSIDNILNEKYKNI
jgi:hypothetical protein